ncbi:MAG: membrane protein insertase YidC, partial [Acidimicrobiales bacterium]|nr:membrane protein insertase YidC [Acidimicrobiales bacterium]
MFESFFDAFANVLNFFFEITGESYGGAIILLTLSVMIILTPLTLKSTRSMMRMQRLQPEMKRLQKEYKDDRQKLNEELMKFYKENNINPLGGCLPLLVQMPVFIVLFRVLQGLVGSLQTRTETSNPCQDSVPVGQQCFVPKHLDADTALYKALNATDQMLWLGIDLAKSASKALSESFTTALPYLAMILLVLVSSYIQQKQVSGRNPTAEVNQQQQMLLKIMPAFMAFISFTLQGALVLYFVVSNFWRVGQQWFIGRHIYGKDDDGNPIEVTARDTTPDEDKPKGFGLKALFTEQAENVRSAREDAKAAKGDGGTKASSAKSTTSKNGSKSGSSKGASGKGGGQGSSQ